MIDLMEFNQQSFKDKDIIANSYICLGMPDQSQPFFRCNIVVLY